MKLSLRSWRPRHLLAAWCAYWAGLALITLWPAIAAGWRISQQVHSQGTVSGSFGDKGITAIVSESGKTTWTGSISVVHLALLIAGPPLLLWLIWLMRASRTNNAERSSIGSKALREPYAPDPRAGTTDSSTSKRPVREES